MGFTGHTPYDWPAPNGYPDTAVAWSGSNSFGMTWKLLNWLSETKDADVPLLPILEATRSGVSQWTSTSLVDFWCRRLLGSLPARRNVLGDFLRQNGAAGDVSADHDSLARNDPKPIGRASCRERVGEYVWFSGGAGPLKKKKTK